jgi:anti-anti-sigma factor
MALGDSFGPIEYTGPTMAIDSPLTIERLPGKAPRTVILRLTGPLTLTTAPPLRAQFRDFEPAPLTILDLSAVPYIDSAGMSEIIKHEVYCRDKRVRLAVAGANRRVLDMLRITHLDKVLNLAATVQEAEARA